MWCRSDARLWHFFYSPLCGVAQTPDCGIIIPHFPLEESFRHSFGTSIIIPHFPLEESFRHSFGTSIIIPHFPLEESFRHSFGTSIIIPHFSARGVFQTLAWHPVLFPLFLIVLVNLFMYFMLASVISYVRTVLRVLSKYSLAY